MKAKAKRHAVLVMATLVTTFSACTTTSIKLNPGDHDRGIRYYRPKPYLLVQPTKNESKEFVTISLEYLPDYSEEYSIRVRAGLGINKTSVKLKDGWNLTEISQELDSQTDENIKAVAELASSVSDFVKTGGNSTPEKPPAPMVVRANNVPIGYYESVISRGPDGKKRLYGWKYVGFIPFNACPTEAAGLQCADCGQGQIFGMVIRDGVMTFAPLEHIANTPLMFGPGNPKEATKPQDGGEDTATNGDMLEEEKVALANQAVSVIADSLPDFPKIKPEDISVSKSGNAITFSLPTPAYAALKTAMKITEVGNRLTETVKDGFGDSAEAVIAPK